MSMNTNLKWLIYKIENNILIYFVNSISYKNS